MGVRWEQATPANPYSHHDCAPDWGTGTVEWWVSWSGCGSGFGSHHSSKRWGSEWGGSVPTPYMTAGGAVGSKSLSPEAAVWMLWENSSAAAAVAHLGLGGGGAENSAFPEIKSQKCAHRRIFVIRFLKLWGEQRIRLFPRNQITKMHRRAHFCDLIS